MPITMPVAMLLGSGIAGGTTIAGMRSQRGAQRDAARQEDRYTAQALQEAREQREYDRQRENENRSYDREQLERQFAYRGGRDAVEDARYADERDYGRGEFSSYKQRLEPFRQIGTNATANLANVVGRQLPGAIPTQGSGATVRLKAPTGQISEVPEGLAESFIQRGATRV